MVSFFQVSPSNSARISVLPHTLYKHRPHHALWFHNSAKATNHEAPHYPVFSIPLLLPPYYPSPSLSTLFSNTLSQCCSLKVTDPVSHGTQLTDTDGGLLMWTPTADTLISRRSVFQLGFGPQSQVAVEPYERSRNAAGPWTWNERYMKKWNFT